MKNKRSRKHVTGQQRRESARRRRAAVRLSAFDVVLDQYLFDVAEMAEKEGLDPADRGTVSMGLEGFDGSNAEFETFVARAAKKGIELSRETAEELRRTREEGARQGMPWRLWTPSRLPDPVEESMAMEAIGRLAASGDSRAQELVSANDAGRRPRLTKSVSDGLTADLVAEEERVGLARMYGGAD